MIFAEAYGHASRYGFDGRELESPEAMTVDTRFDLASITKVAATTLATMVLTECRLVSLDAPVGRYLPGFAGSDWDEVTVELLLTHRAGLAPWWPIYYHARGRDAALAFIRDHPFAAAPGNAHRYSDLGFMLLGGIVEEVSGRRLHEFVAQALYDPLGLHETGYLPAGSARPSRAFAATSQGNPFERRMVSAFLSTPTHGTVGVKIPSSAR